MAEWEDRATKLAAGSEVYRYPDQLRRQLFYEAMPKEAKAIIDLEKHGGKRISHTNMKAFFLSYVTQATLAMSKAPAP